MSTTCWGRPGMASWAVGDDSVNAWLLGASAVWEVAPLTPCQRVQLWDPLLTAMGSSDSHAVICPGA